MFHRESRVLQDENNGRRVADSLVEHRSSDVLLPEHVAFIEAAPFFFIASAHAGEVDCSFKGGAPGFVKATSERTLLYPDYDGNRMYRTLGNILGSSAIGLPFISFDETNAPGVQLRRLRIRGSARILKTQEVQNALPGAKCYVEVSVATVFPNCPRYIPTMSLEEKSDYLPNSEGETRIPEWKTRDYIKDLL